MVGYAGITGHITTRESLLQPGEIARRSLNTYAALMRLDIQRLNKIARVEEQDLKAG